MGDVATPKMPWSPEDLAASPCGVNVGNELRSSQQPRTVLAWRIDGDDVGVLGVGLVSADRVLVQALYSQMISLSLHLWQRSRLTLAH